MRLGDTLRAKRKWCTMRKIKRFAKRVKLQLNKKFKILGISISPELLFDIVVFILNKIILFLGVDPCIRLTVQLAYGCWKLYKLVRKHRKAIKKAFKSFPGISEDN